MSLTKISLTDQDCSPDWNPL